MTRTWLPAFIVLICACASPDDDVGESEAALVEVAPGARTTATLVVGHYHACAITATGTVQCWGSNSQGQLGIGSTTPSWSTPQPVLGVVDAVSLAAGRYHTCAVLSSGQVRCWGSNSDGQLGNGTYVSSATPVTVSGLTYVKEVVAGWQHTCALRANGEARCWGFDAGTLGSGGDEAFSPTPVAVATYTDWKQLTAGALHTCGLRANGEVKCWGRNNEGQLGTANNTSYAVPQGVWWMVDIRQIAAGEDHTCALSEAGRVYCWGRNGSGQLGDGTTTQRNSAVLVSSLTDMGYLAAGGSHTCAVATRGGAVYCWGENDHFQTGRTSPPSVVTPAPVSLSSVTKIELGGDHTCAVTATGQVKCWGDGEAGVLGGGPDQPSATPTTVPLAALRATVSLAVEGKILLVRPDGNAWQWSAGVTPTQTGPMFTTPRMLSTTNWHSCALLVDGTVQCWGANGYGQLGDGTTTFRADPVDVSGLLGFKAVHLDLGGHSSCAVLTDGGVRCWGDGDSYKLGNGIAASSATPVTVAGLENSATQVAVARESACALLVDGRVTCWGTGVASTGSAGDPDKITASPTDPLGVPAIALAGGAGATDADGYCALLADGRAKCWGHRPGNGSAYSAAPADVTLSIPAVAVDKNAENGCVVLATGVVRCWGLNDEGQLGTGSTGGPVLSPTPTASFGGRAIAVSVGGGGQKNACVLTSAGEVYCWGRGFGATPRRQTLP